MNLGQGCEKKTKILRSTRAILYLNNGEDRNDADSSYEDLILRKRVQSAFCKVTEVKFGETDVSRVVCIEK